MTIQQTVTIPDDRRLHFDIEVPFELPVGRAQATLTLVCEDELAQGDTGKWVNPLLGLAKTKGKEPNADELFGMFSDGKLSSTDFIKQKAIEKDMEN